MATQANNPLYQGIAPVGDALVVLLKTDWNHAMISELELGAVKVLEAHGVGHRTLTVPGAFELPFAAAAAIEGLKPDAVICLGAVVRGDTPHFDYVCQGVTQGITQLNARGNVPVIFGVLTVDNEKQAWERIGGKHGHKGEEAALTALKMIHYKRFMV